MEGVPAHPYISGGEGGRVTWKVLAEYSWSPTTTQSSSFLCTAASSTPLRVITKDVRYIHELFLTLEHSMPISSPAAPDLTPTFYSRKGSCWRTTRDATVAALTDAFMAAFTDAVKDAIMQILQTVMFHVSTE